MKATPWLVHGLGSALVVGRLAHAYGLSQTPHIMSYRVSGMVITLTMLLVAAGACVWLGVTAR